MNHPTLVNVYNHNFVQCWLEFDCDLNIVSTHTDKVGEMPGWLEDELDCVGWQSILDIDNYDTMGDLLTLGLVPHQPFMVSLKPHWYRAGWEYPEYDVDFNASIDYICPVSDGHVLRELDRWLDQKEPCEHCKEDWGLK